jgi:MFS transporter, ACS family, tartrate transporter
VAHQNSKAEAPLSVKSSADRDDTAGHRLQQTLAPNLESAVVSRLLWRLMPFLFLLYIIAYLDRINVSFAILQMQGELHLSDRAYGNAAGVFFLSYLLFQVPSNLVLQKVGVRRWICTLMVAWGLISCSMICIRGPRSFYALRFLLGAAEAGFFPGIIFYMKHWFPANARARSVAWFMTANPLAGVVGSPISGALLTFRGGGLAGWQWLFLIEGIPAIFFGAMVLWVLADSPEQVHWLSVEQRNWLRTTLEREGRESSGGSTSVSRPIGATAIRVALLALVCFAMPTCMYGVTFWLPTVIRSLSHLSYSTTGTVALIPYLATAVAMVLVGMRSDHSRERRWHTALPAFLGAAALGVAAFAGMPWVVITGMSLGMVGAESMAGPFWAMATYRMSATEAAASIALINSLGNLGGYFGPYIVGAARSAGTGFRGGLLAIGATMAVSGALALVVGSQSRREPDLAL